MAHRLLITDDSMIIRELIKEVAHEIGFEVAGEAANGAEAVELYERLRPDIVTLDMVMPIHDGLYALRGIRALNQQARVLVISAISQKAVLKEALSLGASDFIVKPFRREQAVRALELLAAAKPIGVHNTLARNTATC